MQVNIYIFGQLVEFTIKNELVIADVNDTDELIKQLHVLYPALVNIKYAISVNKNIITHTQSLKDNDEIALLPPFSGG